MWIEWVSMRRVVMVGLGKEVLGEGVLVVESVEERGRGRGRGREEGKRERGRTRSA